MRIFRDPSGEAGPIANCYLKAATIYLVEERLEWGRGLRVAFALDTLGADPPHLAECNVPLTEEAQIKSFLPDEAA